MKRLIPEFYWMSLFFYVDHRFEGHLTQNRKMGRIESFVKATGTEDFG
jgi:hypothetical protein